MPKSTYTEAKAAEICERLSKGEPLAQICRDKGMPSVSTVWAWERAHAGLSEAIARARLEGYDAIAAECLGIADDGTNDWMEKREGGTQLNAEHVQRSKLRVWTRLQLLAKWDPKRYGERNAVEVSGPGGAPVQVDDSTRSARVAQLMALAAARKEKPVEEPSEDPADGFDDIV